MRRLPTALLLAAALGLSLAGCGLGAGRPESGVQLRVTRDFGTARLGQRTLRTAGQQSVMQLLESHHKVRTRYGGGFVQSIDGIAGGRRDGHPFDWFYYVNGVEAEQGAAQMTVRSGERIWWDFHDWGAAMRVPAVVGSFPEPFLDGFGADEKRLPVRVECADPRASACSIVLRQLHDAGVVQAAPGLVGTEAGTDILRVLVGPWPELRIDSAARQLEQGPKVSGVYAIPAADGRSIAVLDPQGKVVRRLSGDAGLIAATRFQENAPVWVVTGTDRHGIDTAASALEEGDLAQRFALAISNGHAVPAPLVGK